MDSVESIYMKYNAVDSVPLNKGWSNDQKYILTNRDGKKFLLRISDSLLMEKREKQLEFFELIEGIDINCSKLIDFGYLGKDKIYFVFTWIEGIPLSNYLVNASKDQAVNLGRQAGKILKKIHAVTVPQQDFTWEYKFKGKIERKTKAFLGLEEDLPFKEKVLSLYLENSYVMNKRPLSMCHGDYHVGNMIVYNDTLYIIDFDKLEINDPYDDFKPFCWSVFENIDFENALINSYFDNQVPKDFFHILKEYALEMIVSHIPWAFSFGKEEEITAKKVYISMLKWYDNFDKEIPAWYKKEK